MLILAVVYETFILFAEEADRWQAYREARATADALGKPLLNVGCPRKYPMKYPCGDVCLDIDADRLSLCQSAYPALADVRDIPFPNGYFGSALASHVLEHLDSEADAEQALSELVRVADYVFIVSPTRLSVSAWLHPGHHLWVNHRDGGVMLERR
jgi:hypothetical protein